MFAQQQQVEAAAAQILAPVQATLNSMNNGDSTVPKSAQSKALKAVATAAQQLAVYQESIGNLINEMWWNYFWDSVVKYRDIYK